MTIYVVGQARVNDPAGFRKYSETVAGLAEEFGGKLIGAGGPGEKTVIEGDQFSEGRIVIFEYPSLEAYQQLGLLQRCYLNIPVVAVTGSVGKTTTLSTFLR